MPSMNASGKDKGKITLHNNRITCYALYGNNNNNTTK
jgi:hypothetical protein